MAWKESVHRTCAQSGPNARDLPSRNPCLRSGRLPHPSHRRCTHLFPPIWGSRGRETSGLFQPCVAELKPALNSANPVQLPLDSTALTFRLNPHYQFVDIWSTKLENRLQVLTQRWEQIVHQIDLVHEHAERETETISNIDPDASEVRSMVMSCMLMRRMSGRWPVRLRTKLVSCRSGPASSRLMSGTR
jgi:hypothetical protein